MHAIDPNRLPMWVIYDHPTDFPDHFVARMHYSLPTPEPTGHVMLSPNVESLRDFFAASGCTLFTRSPEDDPVIIETWLL
jgi:hypothetical protein